MISMNRNKMMIDETMSHGEIHLAMQIYWTTLSSKGTDKFRSLYKIYANFKYHPVPLPWIRQIQDFIILRPVAELS